MSAVAVCYKFYTHTHTPDPVGFKTGRKEDRISVLPLNPCSNESLDDTSIQRSNGISSRICKIYLD